jgi:hypothetical protein
MRFAMKFTRILRLTLAGLLLLGAGLPRAFATFDPIGEDIDIFLANPPTGTRRSTTKNPRWSPW